MRRLAPLLFLLCTAASAAPAGSSDVDRCTAVLRAETVNAMSQEALDAIRKEVKLHYAQSVVDAVCESSTSISYEGFRHLLDQASEENRTAGGTDYDIAELYFFLECGEEQVNLSPLAYHAFNLNRDDYGFLGEVTLKIVWMSMGYLDTRDPDYNRSFMDIVNRVLAYARKKESATEIEMYEALLEEIRGFREDYVAAADECRSSGQ